MNAQNLEEAAELAKSIEAAEKRKAFAAGERNVVTGSSLADSLVASLESLIASAPDDSESHSETVAPQSETIREAWGWPSRYLQPRELSGDRWHEVFQEARALVARGALVALLGNRGNGKTQMAAEIARDGFWPTDKGAWNGNRMTAGKTALYCRAMDVFLDIRDAKKDGSKVSEKDVIARFEACGLLVIDEFQERGESDWENRVITNLLDKRYGLEKPTILIANFTKDQLGKALGDSIKDRMWESGKSFTFDWESFRRKG